MCGSVHIWPQAQMTDGVMIIVVWLRSYIPGCHKKAVEINPAPYKGMKEVAKYSWALGFSHRELIERSLEKNAKTHLPTRSRGKDGGGSQAAFKCYCEELRNGSVGMDVTSLKTWI